MSAELWGSLLHRIKAVAPGWLPMNGWVIQHPWPVSLALKMVEGKTLGDLLSVTVVLCQEVYPHLQYSEWRTADYAASGGAAIWCHFGTWDIGLWCLTLAGSQGEVLTLFLILHGLAFPLNAQGLCSILAQTLKSSVPPGSQKLWRCLEL